MSDVYISTQARDGVIALIRPALTAAGIGVEKARVHPFRPEELPLATVGLGDETISTETSGSGRITQDRSLAIQLVIARLCDVKDDGEALLNEMLVPLETSILRENLRAASLPFKSLRIASIQRREPEAYAMQGSNESKLLFAADVSLIATALTNQGDPTNPLPVRGF